jgi:glycosyltransferase involved in cell wall biosynthesis
MNPAKNSISVIIPGFNAANFILRALDSISSQIIRPDEVIFIDDCSTDSTLLVIDKYLKTNKLNLKIVSNKINMGACYSRNLGASLSKSKYLAFLDVDDSWAPNKLKQQLEFFQINPNARAVLSHYFLHKFNTYYVIKPKMSYAYFRDWSFGIEPGPALNSSLMIDKEYFSYLGGYEEALFNFAEDLDLAFKILNLDDINVINLPLVNIFQHEFQQHLRTVPQLNALSIVCKKYLKNRDFSTLVTINKLRLESNVSNSKFLVHTIRLVFFIFSHPYISLRKLIYFYKLL